VENRRIRSFDDLQYASEVGGRVLTLFSGGLDSSYVLHKLRDLKCEVYALSVDVGDGDDRASQQSIAEALGAQFILLDRKSEFAEMAVAPAIYAQAEYLGLYPISSSLSRPIIAKAAVDLALELECTTIVHTANQSQNSLRRLNSAIDALGFQGHYGSPYEHNAMTRQAKQSKLVSLGLHCFSDRDVSGDANLWCREFESGSLDNPECFDVPDRAWSWTAPAKSSAVSSANMRSTDTPAEAVLSVRFEHGLPVSVDGEPMSLVPLIDRLNTYVGSYGIGRYEGLEYLNDKVKVLEIREAPAAAILLRAYRHLEMATQSAELLREKHTIEQLWVREAIEGRWFGSLKRSADAFLQSVSHTVSGEVHFSLLAGQARLRGVNAVNACYLTDRDQWEIDKARLCASRSLRDYEQCSEHYSTLVDAVSVTGRRGEVECKKDRGRAAVSAVGLSEEVA
jgi:argininosuccinate synthase